MLIGAFSLLRTGFARDPLASLTPYPGYSAPSTAFVVVALALALLLPRRNGSLAEWLALAGIVVAYDGMAIHAFSLGEGRVATGMALQTGIGLLAAGIGVACLGTGGPLDALRSARAGGALARRLLPAVVLGPVLLGWIATRGMRATTLDPALWTAGLSIGMCTLLGAIVWRSAERLNEEDGRREAAQSALERLNASLETSVAERTESLTRANASLDSFAYSVSHDLRASIRTVAAQGRMLQLDFGDTLDPEALERVERMERAALKMGKLVDDLLQHARSRTAEIHPEPFDLAVLVRDAARVACPDADLSVEGPLPTVADPILVEALLVNLLGNASKYRRTDGRPTIRVGRREAGFFVEDDGIGFPAQDAERIFRLFERATASADGTGIGLANVRGIAERHGGKAWAEAPPEGGARFWFTLG